jgi:sugar O-acyltransferase (sialic acid O-acetyltransferase NeuD family)
MIEDLIILGAGGTSREIADAVAAINRQETRWNLLGFLDDDPAKHGQFVSGHPVLGPISSAQQYPGRFIAGVARAGDPDRRGRVVVASGLPRERFATIIHPSASVSSRARLGSGTAVLQSTAITVDTLIGDHALIHYNVSIAHDCVIEDFVTIAPGATVLGSVRVSEGSYLGARSVIMNGLTVNRGALVGIGAVVIADVPSGVTVFGNPAMPMPTDRRA